MVIVLVVVAAAFVAAVVVVAHLAHRARRMERWQQETEARLMVHREHQERAARAHCYPRGGQVTNLGPQRPPRR